MKRAVVLLSGGIDSATTLYLARKQGYQCLCLVFDYGQRHRKEIDAAKKIAQLAKCIWQIIKIALPWGGSSLLDKNLRMPGVTKSPGHQVTSVIPNTYVPARNSIFLSFALSYAEAIKAEAIFIGAHTQDYSVANNSRVIKNGDGSIPIQECKTGDYILSMDKRTLDIRSSKVNSLLKHKYINQSMYRIITEHGRSIDLSGGHSLFSLNNKGEIKPIVVKDLKKRDYILAPSKLKIFGNIRELNLLDLLSDEEFIFVIHPKLGGLIQGYKNERERWWRRSNIMPLGIYNKFYRKKSGIKDNEIFIKSRKDKIRSIPAILRLNRAFCFFLGLWLADGNFGSRLAVCISCNNAEAIKNLKYICKFFKTKMSIRSNKIDRTISSPLLVKIMKKLGFSGTAKTKIIPPFIYDLPLEFQSAFLRGFIIGDGSVEENGPIDISSVNEALI
ncbi:MAG: 7-cyano-7-deazaguanine synthase, partial [Candidatus Omnitrophica bacterium]|nr:7-cyano-7-deazaguanine synthase [Candidatus Omnitrophota bacterium]